MFLEKHRMKWVAMNSGLVIGWLVRPIINSMQLSGLKYAAINKWLRHVGHAPVVGFMVMPSKQHLVFFKSHPTQERRKYLGGEYRMIEV